MFYRISLLATLIWVFTTTPTGVSAHIAYPDFATSMLRTYRTEEEMQKRKSLYDSANYYHAQLFKSIYESSAFEALEESSTEYRIPKIVHQIWLGSPVPEKYKQWIETWTQLEGWEYRLWTDEEIKTLKFYNQELYDHSTNWGEKSDIARLEILNRFGGIYVDVDFECVNVDILDELHRSYDFYMGFEPLEHGFINYFNMFKLCNALIASSPNHPLMHDLVTNLKANYYAYSPHCGPVERTGPSYITRIVCQYEKRKLSRLRNIYLPSTFLFPFSDPEIKYYSCHPETVAQLMPETAAIHYWSGSWRLPRGCSESYVLGKQKSQ